MGNTDIFDIDAGCFCEYFAYEVGWIHGCGSSRYIDYERQIEFLVRACRSPSKVGPISLAGFSSIVGVIQLLILLLGNFLSSSSSREEGCISPHSAKGCSPCWRGRHGHRCTRQLAPLCPQSGSRERQGMQLLSLLSTDYSVQNSPSLRRLGFPIKPFWKHSHRHDSQSHPPDSEEEPSEMEIGLF